MGVILGVIYLVKGEIYILHICKQKKEVVRYSNHLFFYKKIQRDYIILKNLSKI